MRFLLLLFVVGGLLLFLAAPAVAVSPSATLPLDSKIYPALDKLLGFGLVDSSLQGTRPFTRLEAARQVTEAIRRAEREHPLPVALTLLRRLQVDLRQELAELNNPAERGSYFQPLRSTDLAYLYKNGRDSDLVSTEARQFALNFNNDGIDYREHHNVRLTFETEGRLGRYLLLYVRPLAKWRQNRYGETSDSSLRLLEGRLALGLGPLELSAGRQSLWWGQGRHGALVLSNNAEPLDMLRLTNPTPVLLPWVFRFLGPFRFDFFVSQLEKDRVVPEPYFGGLRINIKPLPWLELGASRTVLFGGEGRPDLDFDDILTIFGGENIAGADQDTSNSIGAIDARLRLPFLWGAELYAELGGEDEGDFAGFLPFPSKKALLAGLYLPRLEPTGRLDLRLEYTDFNYGDNGPVWYRHSVYRSGYTYRGKILGHHAGGDSVDSFAEVRAYLPGAVTLGASYDYEKRGESLPVQETHRQTVMAVEWSLTPHLDLLARYALDRVENFDFSPGDDRTFHLGEFGLRTVW